MSHIIISINEFSALLDSIISLVPKVITLAGLVISSASVIATRLPPSSALSKYINLIAFNIGYATNKDSGNE